MPSGDHFSPLQWGRTHYVSYPSGVALCCLWSSTGVKGRHFHKPFSDAVPAADLLQAGGFLNYNRVAVYAILLRIQSKLFNKKKKFKKSPYLHSSCGSSLSLVAAGTIYQKSWSIHAKREHNKTTRPKMRLSALHSSTGGYPNTTCWFPTAGMQRLHLPFLKADSAFMTGLVSGGM